MKDVSLKNFTTKDYCILFIYAFCMVALFSITVRYALNGLYWRCLMGTLGTVGWCLAYMSKIKEIRKKNQQE